MPKARLSGFCRFEALRWPLVAQTPALLQMAKEKEPGEPFALCAIIRDENRQPVWELESLVRMKLLH